MSPTQPTTQPARRGALLVDHELEALLGSAILPAGAGTSLQSDGGHLREQLQPASLDLRLGARAERLRAGFLPGEIPVERRIERLGIESLDLGAGGAVLERGAVYLVELEEQLALPGDVRARFNPRSSTGRCDIFTRVLACGHPRFDEAPPGYRGKLWIEISPLSFPVRVRRGDRLAQLRLQRGAPALDTAELYEVYRQTPLLFEGARPLGKREVRIDDEGCLELSVSLADRDPAGWRAKSGGELVDFSGKALHARDDYWEPVRATNGRCVLAPESFYIFASRERLRIPPQLAAEMLPVDVGVGELRNNYAGFFDNGFGWREEPDGTPIDHGTPAVLEVRAHDVPFLVEDAQTFCRLRFFRTSGKPRALYGSGRKGGSYQDQDLTLARAFR
jgi:dCTP deaminase